mmetsp:Transcript_73998/g.133403  ORF Transcript_73998/g.133403 Transcript_73998/m.133403 type:complete len:120 (-) Transcript_73998:2-361(-)
MERHWSSELNHAGGFNVFAGCFTEGKVVSPKLCDETKNDPMSSCIKKVVPARVARSPSSGSKQVISGMKLLLLLKLLCPGAQYKCKCLKKRTQQSARTHSSQLQPSVQGGIDELRLEPT